MAKASEFNPEEFNRMYKGTAQFCGSPYFKAFESTLTNDELYEHIKFCNDYLEIPPIKVFVKYCRKQNIGNGLFNKKMSAEEKRGLGKCFGYVFRGLFEYGNAEMVRTGDPITGIVSCSRFTDKK